MTIGITVYSGAFGGVLTDDGRVIVNGQVDAPSYELAVKVRLHIENV